TSFAIPSLLLLKHRRSGAADSSARFLLTGCGALLPPTPATAAPSLTALGPQFLQRYAARWRAAPIAALPRPVVFRERRRPATPGAGADPPIAAGRGAAAAARNT